MGVYLIGAGGHAKVVIDILEAKNISIWGIYDDDSEKIGQNFCGYKIKSQVEENIFTQESFLIAIGDNKIRRKYYKLAQRNNCNFVNAVHPDTTINSNVLIGSGNVFVGGSVVNPYARIGDNCIVNTGATVGHDVIVEDHVHIAPGVNLGGESIVREGVHMGIGSTVIPCKEIGENSTVGAGSVVTKDIPPNVVAYGTPAKVVRKK